MEVFDYDTTALERDRFELWRQIDGGYGCAYLSSERRGAYVEIGDEGRQMIEDELEGEPLLKQPCSTTNLTPKIHRPVEVSPKDVGFLPPDFLSDLSEKEKIAE